MKAAYSAPSSGQREARFPPVQYKDNTCMFVHVQNTSIVTIKQKEEPHIFSLEMLVGKIQSLIVMEEL